MTLGDQPAASYSKKAATLASFWCAQCCFEKELTNTHSGAEPNWGPSEVEHFESNTTLEASLNRRRQTLDS